MNPSLCLFSRSAGVGAITRDVAAQGETRAIRRQERTIALQKTRTLLIRTCSKRAFEAAGNRG
jgi:hypothetical protein